MVDEKRVIVREGRISYCDGEEGLVELVAEAAEEEEGGGVEELGPAAEDEGEGEGGVGESGEDV